MNRPLSTHEQGVARERARNQRAIRQGQGDLHMAGIVPVPLERVLALGRGNPRGPARGCPPFVSHAERVRRDINARIDALDPDHNAPASPSLVDANFEDQVSAYDQYVSDTQVDTDDEIEQGEDLGGLSQDAADRLADDSGEETESHSSFFAPEGVGSPPRLRRSPAAQPQFSDDDDDSFNMVPSVASESAPPPPSFGRKKKKPYVALELKPEFTITEEWLQAAETAGSFEGISLPPEWTWRSELSAGEFDPDFQWLLPEDIQGNPAGPRYPRRVFCTILTPSMSEALRGLRWGMDKCKFSSGCFERCPTTGRFHMHFYWNHDDTKSLRVMQTAFPRANFQTAGGTEMQCRAYTSKEGFGFKIHEDHFACGAGSRRDLHSCGQHLLTNGYSGLDDIVRDDPGQFMRYFRGMGALLEHTVLPRHLLSPPKVTWFYGEAGSGKSFSARTASSALVPSLGPVFDYNHLNHPWVENYKQERIIVMQDIRAVGGTGLRIEPSVFLKMWDVDAYVVQKKGSSYQFQGEAFFVTCCIHPAEFYRAGPGIDNPLQFLRRISEVILCEVEGEDLETAVFSQRKLKRGSLKDPWPADRIVFE